MSATTFLGMRLAALGSALVVLACAAAPASAQQAQLRNWLLGGTIAVNGHALPLPHATVDGTLDLGTGKLTSQMGLLPVTTRVTVPGTLGATADLSLTLEEAAPLAGEAGFAGPNIVLDTSPAFLLHVQRARSFLPALNLDSDTCRSEVPFTLPLDYQGPLNFATGFSFSGTVLLPKFERCGLSTARLDQLLSGSGTFTASLTPAPNSPDPLAGVVTSPGGSGGVPAASSGSPSDSGAALDVDPGAGDDGVGAGLPDLSSILSLVSDTQSPNIQIRVRRSQRLLRSGSVAVVARCDERCLVTATGTLKIGRRSYKLLSASDVGRVGTSKTLKVRLGDRARRQLRAALKRSRRATVRLGVRGTDAAGNRSDLLHATVTVTG